MPWCVRSGKSLKSKLQERKVKRRCTGTQQKTSSDARNALSATHASPPKIFSHRMKKRRQILLLLLCKDIKLSRGCLPKTNGRRSLFQK